ncbi:MAG: hypothetical protein U0271_04750 [Polyangiaceae bacterium]
MSLIEVLDSGVAADIEARCAPLLGRLTDALLAEVDPAEVAELESWLRAHPGPEAPIRDWLNERGRAAGWVLARHTREAVRARLRYVAGGNYYGWEIVQRFRSFADWYARRPEGPWLSVEVLTAVPTDKAVLASHLSYFPLIYKASGYAAMRCGIRARAAHRGELARSLARQGAFTIDDALDALSDPPLRDLASDRLKAHVREVEPALRELARASTRGTREAAVELLRAIDARIELSGKRGSGNLSELELALRENPNDEATSRVWADLLAERGDARGRLVALDHAIRDAETPERALELSAERGALFHLHRKAIVGKAGGFPFCERYLGRSAIGWSTSWRARLRGGPRARWSRLVALLRAITDARAPRVHFSNAVELDGQEKFTKLDPETPLQREIARVFGVSFVLAAELGDDQREVFADAAPDAAIDLDALGLIVEKHADELSFSTRFRLLHPKTRVLLPYQEPGHYPPGVDADSYVILNADGGLYLSFFFPFESFEAPLFSSTYDAIAGAIGANMLTPTGFNELSPTADQKKLKSKRTPFARR